MSKISYVHVNKQLTNFSLRYSNAGMIADIIAPRIPVAKDSDIYYLYGRQNFRIDDAKRAAGTPANQVDALNIDSTPSYVCEWFALKDLVTDDDRRNSDAPLNIDVDTTENITEKILLGREKRVADLVTALATWGTTGATLSGTQQWNNASFDSDSKTDAIEVRIDTAKEQVRAAIGADPNTIIIPAAVAKVVKRDPEVRELVKYTDNSLLVNGDLPPRLWNMRVLVPGSIYDSAEEGQTFSGADVWGKHVVVMYCAPNPRSLKTMTALLTMEAVARETRRWRKEELKGDYIEVGEKLIEKAVGTYCASVIRSAIA